MAFLSLYHLCEVFIDDLLQLIDSTLHFQEHVLAHVFSSSFDFVEFLIIDAELAILNWCDSFFESNFLRLVEVRPELAPLFHHLFHSFHENLLEIVWLGFKPQFENFVHHSILQHQAQTRHSLKLFIWENVNASAEFLVLVSEVELSFLVVEWGEVWHLVEIRLLFCFYDLCPQSFVGPTDIFKRCHWQVVVRDRGETLRVRRR